MKDRLTLFVITIAAGVLIILMVLVLDSVRIVNDPHYGYPEAEPLPCFDDSVKIDTVMLPHGEVIRVIANEME